MSQINVKFKEGILKIEKDRTRQTEDDIEIIDISNLIYKEEYKSKIKVTNIEEKNKILLIQELEGLNEIGTKDAIVVYSGSSRIMYKIAPIENVYKIFVKVPYKILKVSITKKYLKFKVFAYLNNKFNLNIQNINFAIDSNNFKEVELKEYLVKKSKYKMLLEKNIYSFKFKISDLLDSNEDINNFVSFNLKINDTNVQYKLGIKDKKFLISILLGVVGTFLFFFSLSGFILYIVKKNKKIYFKGLNIFIVKQINSKVNTNFISMSVICLMLFMTIGMLSTGFSFKNAIESGLKDSTPYDASANLYIDEGEKANDIQKSLEYIGVKFNKEDKVVYYDLYTDNKTISEALNLNANMRSLMNYMKLSDYNKIRALDNKNAIELNKDEVLITSNYANKLEAIQNYVKNNDSIKIENKSYKIKDKKVIEENLKTDFMKDNMITVIVNDDICDNMTLVSSNVNVNFVGEGKEKRESDFTNKIYSYKTTDTDYDKIGFVLGASRTEIYESNKGMTTIVLFIGIYIGIVFLISSMAVLALQQLSEASDSIDRYKSLKRLGASEKDINKTIFIQTLVYFSLPVILAFIHSVIGIKVANDFVSVYNKPDIMGSSLITAGIFMIVYIIYFYITYSGYKNIVKNKIHIK